MSIPFLVSLKKESKGYCLQAVNDDSSGRQSILRFSSQKNTASILDLETVLIL